MLGKRLKCWSLLLEINLLQPNFSIKYIRLMRLQLLTIAHKAILVMNIFLKQASSLTKNNPLIKLVE